MKDLFHGIALHDVGGFSKGDLFLIEDKGVGENLGHAFHLVVGSDDEVAAVGKFDEGVGEVAAAFDIEAIEGFIEEEDVGFLGEGAGDEGALLLAAGELVDLAMGDVTEIHGGDGFCGLGPIDFPEALEMAEVWEATHCYDIAHPDWEVALVAIDLGKVSNFTACFREGIFTPLDGAGLLFEESGEESDEGAFAGAVWAQEGEALAAVG